MTSVVWITSEASATPRSGGTIRTLRLLTALAARAPVDLVVVGDRVDAAALKNVSGVRSIRWFGSVRAPTNRVTAATRGWPIPVARCWRLAAARYVRALQRTSVTVVEHSLMAPYRPTTGPFVFSIHNAETARLPTLPLPRSAVRRCERRWDVAAMRRLELATAADPRASVVAVSAVDAAVVRRPSAVVVPNGVDLPSAVPARPVDGDLLFVGALDYEPNREALAWYADEIFGKLPASLPPLTAVGRGGPAALGRLSAHPALRVVGEVPDVGPYLAAASVVVVPLRSGGGSRIKVLEAAAWQRPIVATHKAVEGLPMLDGVHAMLADEPAAFAAALQRVHSDHALAESITASAQLVAAGHAWPAVADRFVAVVEELRRPVPGMTAL